MLIQFQSENLKVYVEDLSVDGSTLSLTSRVCWCGLAQDRVRWRAVMNTVMKL
jgi:hypothetical protein